MSQTHDDRLLGIYLNDHLAALVTGRELVKRMNSAGARDDERPFLTELESHFRAGEWEVERLLRQVGGHPSQLKRSLAWAAEKVGRLKLNGRIRERSPLSGLVELEGLAMLLEYEHSLWCLLQQAAPQHAQPPDDFSLRAERARQRRDLCQGRAQALAKALQSAAVAEAAT